MPYKGQRSKPYEMRDAHVFSVGSRAPDIVRPDEALLLCELCLQLELSIESRNKISIKKQSQYQFFEGFIGSEGIIP